MVHFIASYASIYFLGGLAPIIINDYSLDFGLFSEVVTIVF